MTSVVVVAHHTPDLYGSDRQLLESVTALMGMGLRVVVSVPTHGPLVPLLEARGATVEFLRVPVLRKDALTPFGLLGLATHSARSILPAIRLLRRHRASAIYVNTLITPLWLVAAKMARVPALCHVHEAQTEGPRILRALLVAPLLLTRRTVVNSQASVGALRASLRVAARHTVVVYNGIPGPPTEPSPPLTSEGRRGRMLVLVLVARLSPRKGIDVALEATGQLVERGYDVQLRVAGTVFEGYEWYEQNLRRRAERPDLLGHVSLLGYVHPTWELLSEAIVVLVPSRTEPFGNTAVEAQLAMRPVVASKVQGLQEIIVDGETGILVPPDDPTALADAVAALLDDPDRAARMAGCGRSFARTHFSTSLYAEQIVREMRGVLREPEHKRRKGIK